MIAAHSLHSSTSAVAAGTVLWEETVKAGAHWSGILRRGLTLRLTDTTGGVNAAVLLYAAANPLERYNMADTLKAQHTAFLTRGHVCYSDMGRILCSITADTCGWHDTLCGTSNAAHVKQRFGTATYQSHRNDFHRNGYDSFLNELGKFELGPRDIMPNLNFFSKVTAAESGTLAFQSGHSKPGSHVDLRFEMPTLMILSTCQHPLDPSARYEPRPIQLTALQSAPVPIDDECRQHCPENQRGFINTERLFL
jgi:urea carboxylase-associated protein 2